MIPYAGLSFSIFEYIKAFVLRKSIVSLTTKSNAHRDDCHKYELNVGGKLICGG
jgi:hypothetical protein